MQNSPSPFANVTKKRTPHDARITIKYLLLQNLRVMRTPFTGELIELNEIFVANERYWALLTRRTGLGARLLPYSDRPHWSLWIHQHCYHLP